MSNRNHNDHTSYCTRQAMTHDRERFLSAMMAPQSARPALVALIAWNHEVARVGEVASDEMIGLIRYQWWRDALDEVFAGKPPRQHAVVLALAEAIAAHGLPKEPFFDILSAREADLDRTPFAALEQLDEYAARTGGAFLKLWLPVLGVQDSKTADAVEHVGTAWALVGGLRACHHMAHLGKLRLPTDALSIDADTLLQEGFTPEISRTVRRVAERAEEHLHAARTHRDALPKAALPPLTLAVQAEDFLARLKLCGYDPANPRIEKGRASRAFRLWRAKLTNRF